MPTPDDKSLDERLRDVSVPPWLTLRLRGVSRWDDRHLDAELCDVPEPPGLCHRLRQIVQDQRLDDRLRDVTLPSVVVARARIIPYRRRRSRIGRFVVAATLLIALSIGTAGWLGGVLWLVRPVQRPQLTLMVMDRGPLQLASPPPSNVRIVTGPGWNEPSNDRAADGFPPDRFPLLLTLDRVEPGPAGRLVNEWGAAWDPNAHWVRLRWPVFGYLHPEAASLPDLERVELPEPRGIPVSLAREFDREFFFSRGASPPVVNRSDSDARRLTVPLSGETSSWEQLRQQLQHHRFPSTDQIHVEDFLAAVDYRLAPPDPGRLALRSAAGVSAFNPQPAGLLQVSVKAGQPPVWPRPATHLTVALDASASMDWDQRFAAAREGMVRALAQLRPDDRFSLVVFREEPQLLVSQATSDDLTMVFAALDGLRPAGGANVGEALPHAIAAALETDADRPVERRLVLISDSPAILVPEAAAGIERLVQDAPAFGFDVLDLGDRQQTDPHLERCIQATRGSIRRVQSSADIRWALLDSLRGPANLVARQAELTIDFNPKAVAAYRLIGHHSPNSVSYGTSTMTADLLAGQEITSLFEVWLKPNQVDDVAVAQLRWLGATDDRPGGTESIRISRVQFSTSFEGCAVSLQQAAIVAEAVEVLTHSFNFDMVGTDRYRYAPKPRDLRHVLLAVEQANPQLRDRPDFQRMLGFLARADRISSDRPLASARSGLRGMVAGRWRESRE
jgi:hypothetical protein